MSLINQVLQDLQDRRAPDFDTAAATLRDITVPTAKPAPRHALPPVLLWIMIALLAGISAALLWHREPTPGLAARPEATGPTHAPAPAPLSSQVVSRPTKSVPIAADATPAPPAKPIVPAAPTAITGAAPVTPAAAVPAISTATVPAIAPVKAATSLANAAPTAPLASVAGQPRQKNPPRSVDAPAAAEMPALRHMSAAPAAVSDAANPVEKTLRPMSAEQQAELAYRDGMRLLQSGRPSIATPRLQAALSALPAYYPARAALAALLINSNRLAEAHTLLAAGLELAPQQATLAKLDGRLLIEQGQLPQARVVLERAAPPVSADPEYYSVLGVLYQRLGLYAQAAQSYRSIVELEPRNGVWWLGLAMALEGTGDTHAARAAYEQAQQTGSLNGAVLQFVQAKLAALP